MKKLTTIAFIVLAVSCLTQATVIVKYDFGTYPGTLAASSIADHISLASNFGYSGNGTADFTSSGNPGYARQVNGGWDDLSYIDYFYFTVTIAPGWSLDVSNLRFDYHVSNNGPVDAQIAYVANSVEKNIETGIGITSGWDPYQTHSPAPTDLKGEVMFKIYAKNTLSGGGQFNIDNVILNGTVQEIPEPATICILGLGALSLIRQKK